MLDLGLFDIIVPIVVLIIAVVYIPVTVCGIVRNRRFYQLTSWNKFQQAWFARFWLFFGWASRFLFVGDVETVLSQAHGVVLDIGTGSGDWLYMFAAARNKNISKLLLLEPNRHFHKILREKAEQLGLTGKYEIMSGGIEDLAGMGIQKGTIDTITTVHVLCSVASPESFINELYQYLKTGGKWLVYEHIKVRDNKSAAAVVQERINMAWPIFFDGCSMTRNTEDILLHTGKWRSTDLRHGSNEGRFSQMPHTVGTLVKEK